MAGKYEPFGKERFRVEQSVEGERIRIPTPRHIFPLLFLPVWLTGWTIGGITAISELISQFQPFLVIWLCGWAFGWVAAAGTIAWMLAGSETLRVIGGDLEITHQALGFSRTWLYQGGGIRHLQAANVPSWPFGQNFTIPFLRNTRQGSIRFDYGARSFYAGSGLDEAEARQIVERLLKRMPANAAPATF